MARRILYCIAASVAAHAAMVAAVAWLAAAGRAPAAPASTQLPVELVAAPVEAPPPAATAALPAPAPAAAAPAPEPPRPRRPRRPAAAPPAPAGTQAAVAETPTETPPPGAAEGELGAATDALVAAAASAVDLAPFAPGGARLRLVVRTDRLRGTPWLAALDAILAPMPDYRTVIAGSGLALGDDFDLLLVSTPNPRDVTATFLAARMTLGDEAIRAAMAGTKETPRVVWEPGASGYIGHRKGDPRVSQRDTRVFLMPHPGWILLTRPEHVAALIEPAAAVAASADAGAPDLTPPPPAPPARPVWLDRLTDLVGDPAAGTGAPGPIAILGASNLGRTIDLPGLAQLPAPAQLHAAIHADANGLTIVGTFVFGNVAGAKKFLAAAEAARAQALDGVATRLVLSSVRALGAVKQLTFVQSAETVVFSTSIATADAEVLLEAAASWTREYFEALRVNR